MSKFGCYGNSLGSLENLESAFEFPDAKNHTIHAENCVDILYSNEVMSIWMFGVSLLSFLDFCENSRNG